MTDVLFALDAFLGAAVRLFDRARTPDIVHITSVITRLCLDAPIIRALPRDRQREMARCIMLYMTVSSSRHGTADCSTDAR